MNFGIFGKFWPKIMPMFIPGLKCLSDSTYSKSVFVDFAFIQRLPPAGPYTNFVILNDSSPSSSAMFKANNLFWQLNARIWPFLPKLFFSLNYFKFRSRHWMKKKMISHSFVEQDELSQQSPTPQQKKRPKAVFFVVVSGEALLLLAHFKMHPTFRNSSQGVR